MKHQPVAPEIREIVVRMWPDDVPWREIAALTGLTKNAIIGIAHRAGVVRGHRNMHPKGTIRAVLDAWRAECSTAAIAKANGLTTGQVYRIIKNHGRKPDPAAADRLTLRAERLERWARRGGCRWIVGDPREDFEPCGAEAVDGGDWCQHHRAKVYTGQRAA